MKEKKKMWISEHTPTQELQVSLILLSPLSSVCSLTERSGLLAHWEICKDNEKSGEDGRFNMKKRDFRTCSLLNNMSFKCWSSTKKLQFSQPLIYDLHPDVESLMSNSSYGIALCISYYSDVVLQLHLHILFSEGVSNSKYDFRISARLSQRLQLNEWTQQTWKLTLLKHVNELFHYANENVNFPPKNKPYSLRTK